MGLLYLLVGLACGVAVGMGVRKKDQSTADAPAVIEPRQEEANEPPGPSRFPDVEYDLESDET